MINSRGQYLFVSGDLSDIIIDGGVMPLRANAKILRGEDIAFLKEAYCERYNAVRSIQAADWSPRTPTQTISRTFSKKILGSGVGSEPHWTADMRSLYGSAFTYTMVDPDASLDNWLGEPGVYTPFREVRFHSGRYVSEAGFETVNTPAEYGGVLRREPIMASFRNLRKSSRFANNPSAGLYTTTDGTVVFDARGGAEIGSHVRSKSQFWKQEWRGAWEWVTDPIPYHYEWGWYKAHIEPVIGRTLYIPGLCKGAIVHLFIEGMLSVSHSFPGGNTYDEYRNGMFVGSRTVPSDGATVTFTEAEIVETISAFMEAKVADGTFTHVDIETPTETPGGSSQVKESVISFNGGTLYVVVDLGQHTHWWV